MGPPAALWAAGPPKNKRHPEPRRRKPPGLTLFRGCIRANIGGAGVCSSATKEKQ